MISRISEACSRGNVEEVKRLLANPQINPDNFAIKIASRKGHTEIVRLLLADGRVNPVAENNQAIRWACANGHLDVVKLLLADSRVNPADWRNGAIRVASYCDRLEVVKLLLADPRVNPKDEEGISIPFPEGYNIDIAVIDNVVCRCNKIDRIDDDIREKFIRWQYRIGGHKWALAKQNLQN